MIFPKVAIRRFVKILGIYLILNIKKLTASAHMPIFTFESVSR